MTGTVYLYTLRESIHRRMGLVILVISLISPIIYFWNVRFETRASDGLILVHAGNAIVPAPVFVPANFQGTLALASGIWMFLGVFAGGPLMASYLEKGWVDLVLSKGVPRWQVLLERYLGALTLFITSLMLLCVIPALYIWWGTRIPPWKYFLALLLIVFSYAAVLALMALASVSQSSAAMLIILGFLQLSFSGILAEGRAQNFRPITSPWILSTLEWMYKILPKNSELRSIGSKLVVDAHPEMFFVVWSTAAFLVACLVLASVLLHRKSF